MDGTAAAPITGDQRRAVTAWAAECAERVLPVFEAQAPGDDRPREAIAAAVEYAREGRRTARLRKAGFAALAAAKAAKAAGDLAAEAAAWSAGLAAGAPYIHPLASAHQARHVHGPAMYAARARELAGGDPDAEIRWAAGHAPAAAREVLALLPAPEFGRSRLEELRERLDAALRSGGRPGAGPAGQAGVQESTD